MSIAERAQTIVNQAIKNNQLPISGVYCYYLPENVVADTKHSVILVSEVLDMPTDYGSNHSTTMQEKVGLNIFYGRNTQIDFDKLEQQLITAFENAGWTVTYSPGHSVDPTTKQISKVFQFQHYINKGEI